MTGANAATIAALLRLADGTPLAGALRLTMRETVPNDGHTDRAAAFGALYAGFSVAGLSAEAKEQAAQLLAALG